MKPSGRRQSRSTSNGWTGVCRAITARTGKMWWRPHADHARGDIRPSQDTVIYFIIYFLSMGDGTNHRGTIAMSSRFSETRRPAPAGRARRDPGPHRRAPCAPGSPTGAVSTGYLAVIRRQRCGHKTDLRTISLNAHEVSRNGTRVGPIAGCRYNRTERSRGGRRTISLSQQNTRRAMCHR